MLIRTALGAIACLGIVLAMANASPMPHPGAKIINVREALARQSFHNTPASEEAAAGWKSLPRVVFLRQRDQVLDPIKLLPGVKPLLDGLAQFPH